MIAKIDWPGTAWCRSLDGTGTIDQVRTLRWLSAAAWIVSWRIVYLEIHRWHHMSRTLRFTGPSGAKPGIPVRAIRVCAVVSPLAFLVSFLS